MSVGTGSGEKNPEEGEHSARMTDNALHEYNDPHWCRRVHVCIDDNQHDVNVNVNDQVPVVPAGAGRAG